MGSSKLASLELAQQAPCMNKNYGLCLQGVVNAAVGQENGSREHLKIAQQYFQLVGGKHFSDFYITCVKGSNICLQKNVHVCYDLLCSETFIKYEYVLNLTY